MNPSPAVPHLTISLPPLPRKRLRPATPAIFSSTDEDDSPEFSAAKLAAPLDLLEDTKPPPAAPDLYVPDLQRRHLRRRMARRLASTPKRSRTAPPEDLNHPPVKPIEVPSKPPYDPARINGRTTISNLPRPPETLWEKLASAKKRLEAQPRQDQRFVSARRPLDCIDNLRVSIAITLFHDGYARHDWTAASAETATGGALTERIDLASQSRGGAGSSKGGGPKNTSVATLPRYPYDRASRDFLRSLDLGLLPPAEDLPDPSARHYYDGCLIAEVNDFRDSAFITTSNPKPSARRRILLRPDMSSIYQDFAIFTASCNRAVAVLAEQKILNTIAGVVSCDPFSWLTSPTQSSAVHTNCYAFNTARRPKRRRMRRPPGPSILPSLSSAALLLIAKAAKQQALQREAAHGSGAGGPDNGTTSSTYGPPDLVLTSGGKRVSAISTRRNGAPLNTAGQMEKEANDANANGERLIVQRPTMKKGIPIPPKMLFEAHRGKGDAGGAVATTVNSAAQNRARTHPERVRTLRLVVPDEKGIFAMQQAQAQILSAGQGNASRDQVLEAKQQALSSMAKPGKQILILDMVRKGARAVEITIFRGLQGDKSRDVFRIPYRNSEDGHAFLAQFKYIASQEGYFCMQDFRPQAVAQQQMRVAQQRQGAGATGRQQAVPSSLISSQSQQVQLNMAQARAPAQSRMDGSAQQLVQAQKQKQLLLQRQQQLQRQRQQPPAQSFSQAQHQQQSAQLHQQAQQRQAAQHPQQIPHPQAPQHQLGQVPQHQQHIALQQHQILRQQIQQHQMQHHMQQQQSMERARMLQQLQRHEKGNVSIQQSAAALAANGSANHVFSKPMDAGQAASAMSRTPNAGVARNGAQLANMGSSTVLGQSQGFPPHLQHLQHIQTQQMREQRRAMLAAAASGHPVAGFQRNGNIPPSALTAAQQHLQTQTLAGMGAAMSNNNARPGPTSNLNGADALAHQHRLQQHFKQPHENIEAQSRTGKR